jgi:uncharacterized protein YhaN
LAPILGGASRELYRSIFAFGLGELQQFDSINQDCVRDIIYSAGLGLGGKGLTKALGALDKTMSELYLPNGRTQPIRKALRTIDEAEKEEQRLANTVDEYDRLSAALVESNREVERLESERTQLQEKQARLSALHQAREAYIALLQARARLEGAELSEQDQTILKQAAAITACERSREGIGSALEELPAERSKLAREEELLMRALRSIHPTWSLEEALRFDLSAGPRSEVEAFRLQEVEGKALLQQAESSLTLKRREREALRTQVDRLEPSPTAAQTVTAEQVQEFESKVQRIEDLLVEIREGEIRQSGLHERLADLEAEATTTPPAPAQGIPTISVALALLGLGCAWGLSGVAGWPVGAGIGITFFTAALYLWHHHRRQRRQALQSARASHTSRLAERLAALRSEADALAKRIADSNSIGTDLLNSLGADGQPLERATLRDLQHRLKSMQSDLAEGDRRTAERDRLRRDLEALSARCTEDEEALKELQHSVQCQNEAWTAWLSGHDLPPSLAPHAALSILEDLAALHERAERIESLRSGVRIREERLTRFAHQVLEIQTPHSEAIQNPTDPQRALLRLEELSHRLEEARQAEARLREGQSEVRQAEVSFERVGDEDLRQEVQRSVAPSPEETERTQEELSLRLEDLRHAIKEACTRQGALESERAGLASEDERRACLVRAATAREALERDAQTWSAAALARAVMQQAREHYERERQPGVIQSASSLLNTITDGRYPRIITAPDGGEPLVERADGKRMPLPHLSRGTAEQLYLAIRLGLIAEYCRHNPTLPIVMDDILVNFDPDRAVAAARALSDLGHDHQILFFTCHPYPGHEAPRAL